MAKLTDLTEWISDTLRGDQARARSLIQVARKNHLFVTGGRGRGAPDMTYHDAANALILALYDGPPTLCVAAFEEYANLEAYHIEVAPNGPREEDVIRLFNNRVHEEKFPLPTVFKELPLTPLEALRDIFSAPTPPYFLDRVSLNLSSSGAEFYLVVHDCDREIVSDLESETDVFQLTVRYGFPNLPGFQTRGKSTSHTLMGDQLAELHQLISGDFEEEVSFD